MNPLDLYNSLEESLKEDIIKNGFVQDDKHFNRKVWALPGHFIVIKEKELLDFLRKERVLPKYKDDYYRMANSYLSARNLAREDKDSRQLVIFNDYNYDEVHQCFTHMQFVMTQRGEFDLYVYQRSADISKLKDDLVFFSSMSRYFEEDVQIPVTKIVVVYGHVHFTKE